MAKAKEGKKASGGWFRRLNSLRNQVGAIVVLSYLIPALLLGTFTGTILLRGLEEKTRSAVSSSAEHAFTMIQQNVTRAVELARGATYDGELTSAWQRWQDGSAAHTEFLQMCRRYLERKYSREPLFNFAGFFPAGRPDLLSYIRSSESHTQEYLNNLLAEVARAGETLDTRSRFISFGNRMFLIRNLLDLKMERYGMLILGVNPDRMFEPLNGLQESWQAEVSVRLDDYARGEPVTDWNTLRDGLTDDAKAGRLLYTQLSGGEENIADLMLSVDRRQQFSDMYAFRRLTIGMFLALIPFLILIAVYLHRRITKPIKILSDASRRIEEGELGVTVPMHGSDELGRLGETFSHMSLRLKEQIDKTYKEEIELKNAQILALQSRINPHFMNNALEAINWEARMEGSETISSMVGSLSILMNATMGRKERRLVTLREEMEVADAYIYFVQQRFGPELTIRQEIDEPAYDGILPLLTVQPLLENAVEHGIAPAGGGEINIKCTRGGECLHLGIINTGKTADPADRARIEAALQGRAEEHHLGLANIVNRLHLIYGEQVQIRVDTDTPGETGVYLDIPQDVTVREGRE
ncbi:sensor histidine kinase [Clostridiales bacterium]|nr:sensor histidine kinase [Clostridiales bacterium]